MSTTTNATIVESTIVSSEMPGSSALADMQAQFEAASATPKATVRVTRTRKAAAPATLAGIVINYVRNANILDSERKTHVFAINAAGTITKPSLLNQLRNRSTPWASNYRAAADKGTLKLGLVLPCSAHAPQHLLLSVVVQQHVTTKADMAAIAKGMNSIVKSFAAMDMQSFAFAKLGCGQGDADWEEVGPIMARALGSLPAGTQVAIHIGRYDAEFQPQYAKDGSVKGTTRIAGPERIVEAVLPE